MMKTFSKIAAFRLLLVTLAIGCSRHDGGKETPRAAEVHASARPVAAPPLRIAGLLDKTGSAGWTRTPDLTIDQLNHLVDMVMARGGELGLGLVRESSNKLFARLTILPPPSAPVVPSEEKNALVRRREKSRYEIAARHYEEKIAAWRSENEKQRATFLADAETLLATPADAPQTDLCNAIARADLFLSEPDEAFSQPTRRYLVVVSDGQDNVTKCGAPELRSGAEILLINGSASLGVLEGTAAQRFESIDGGLSYLMARERNETR